MLAIIVVAVHAFAALCPPEGGLWRGCKMFVVLCDEAARTGARAVLCKLAAGEGLLLNNDRDTVNYEGSFKLRQ